MAKNREELLLLLDGLDNDFQRLLDEMKGRMFDTNTVAKDIKDSVEAETMTPEDEYSWLTIHGVLVEISDELDLWTQELRGDLGFIYGELEYLK